MEHPVLPLPHSMHQYSSKDSSSTSVPSPGACPVVKEYLSSGRADEKADDEERCTVKQVGQSRVAIWDIPCYIVKQEQIQANESKQGCQLGYFVYSKTMTNSLLVITVLPNSIFIYSQTRIHRLCSKTCDETVIQSNKRY